VKTYYVDPAAGERHLLVRMASSAVTALSNSVQSALLGDTLLLLRNQAAIMRALAATAHGPTKTMLLDRVAETETRLAEPEPLEAAA
jgi:hypothetical protein